MTASKRSGRRRDPRGLSAARLNAVQALYEIEIADAGPDPVLREFFGERWTGAGEGDPALVAPDGGLLAEIVRGVLDRRPDLDRMIDGALDEGRTAARLEVVLLVILRAGVFEMLTRTTVPARVAITEYVEVARAFYAGTEPALVNAVLDRVAKTLRPAEFEAGGAGEGG